jgi:hypothetical protein
MNLCCALGFLRFRDTSGDIFTPSKPNIELSKYTLVGIREASVPTAQVVTQPHCGSITIPCGLIAKPHHTASLFGLGARLFPLYRSSLATLVPCITRRSHESSLASVMPRISHPLPNSFLAKLVPCINPFLVTLIPCINHPSNHSSLASLIPRITHPSHEEATASAVPCIPHPLQQSSSISVPWINLSYHKKKLHDVLGVVGNILFLLGTRLSQVQKV